MRGLAVKVRELVVGLVGGSRFAGHQKWEKNFWESCACFEAKVCWDSSFSSTDIQEVRGLRSYLSLHSSGIHVKRCLWWAKMLNWSDV